MSLKEWIASASTKLKALGITSGTIDAQLILCHALNRDKSYLLAHGDDKLEAEAVTKANELLRRRLNHEPMAFLLGSREFFGLTLKTDKRALIPRGESEVLVEEALKWLSSRAATRDLKASKISRKARNDKLLTVVEVGTGAGGIICALAKHAPDHTYVATEVDSAALDLAKQNAADLNLNIDFRLGDLCNPIQDLKGKIDLLVANLPYIPEGLLTVLDPTVQYFEPHLALSGGSDGLDIYRDFIPETKDLLATGGSMIVEHEFDQGQAMRELVLQVFPNAKVETKTDFSGHDRITVVELPW